MHRNIEKRIDALEQASGDPRYFVAYPDEARYILPGGRPTDVDTFATAVERAGPRATVIRVEYAEPVDALSASTKKSQEA